MKTQKNDRRFLILVVLITALLLCGLSSQALAGPGGNGNGGGGGGGGGGGVGDQPCVIFDVAGSILSDGAGDPIPDSYCNNKKKKVEVSFSNDGHLRLATNSSNKAGAGRSLFVDFGVRVLLNNLQSYQTTDEALADVDGGVSSVSAVVTVGAFQDEFDFFDSTTYGSHLPGNVNLTIRVLFNFADGTSDSILVRLAPNWIDNGRYCDQTGGVTVTDIPDPDLRKWAVYTDGPNAGVAVITRSGVGEGGCPVPPILLGTGSLDFSFFVTAEP